MPAIKKIKAGDVATKLEEAVISYYSDKTKESLYKTVISAEPLIKFFALKYCRKELAGDLMQVGYIGFLKSLNSYKHVEGAIFTTYACHCILGEIRHFLRKENTYYTPGDSLNLENKIKNFTEVFRNKFGKLPTVPEIAKEFNVKENYVIKILNSALVPMDDLENTYACMANCNETKMIENRILLNQLLAKLKPMHRKVLVMVYFKDYTQTQVANVLGLNQRKVSRIVHKCLKTLKNEVDNQ